MEDKRTYSVFCCYKEVFPFGRKPCYTYTLKEMKEYRHILIDNMSASIKMRE